MHHIRPQFGAPQRTPDCGPQAVAAKNRSRNVSTSRTLSARPRPATESAEETTPTVAAAAGGRQQSLQDAFLNLLRKTKTPVTMFLVKGVKLQGIVTWFDNFSILLRRDGQSQLVYKHAVSTIMPSNPVDANQFASQGSNAKQRLLQDVFLSRVREAEVQVTMFLVNGVMLQGKIAAYDLFCMLLEREGYVQLAYKHAVSTIQPASAVDLSDDFEDEDD
jgi:host factor-I protein